MNKKTTPTPLDLEAEQRTAQLLREAEEALSHERLITFWQTHGKTILGMALMLVVGTAAGTVWRQFSEGRDAKTTATLLQAADPMMGAVKMPDVEKLETAFANLKGQPKAIGALLLANIAGMSEQPDTAKLEKLLQVNVPTGSNVWGWLASWAATRVKLDDEKAEPQKLVAALNTLADQQKGTAFEALARIDAALVEGERLNNPQAALDHLKKAETVVQGAPSLQNLVSELQHIYDVATLTAAKETK